VQFRCTFADGRRRLDVQSRRTASGHLVRADRKSPIGPGLDVFGVGGHHRREFSTPRAGNSRGAGGPDANDSGSQRRHRVSAADPGRVFQNFETLDLLSQGRAENGRRSRCHFIESFPLCSCLQLEDYDSLFAEKARFAAKTYVTKNVVRVGNTGAASTGKGVYPRPMQNPAIWMGRGRDTGIVRPPGDVGNAVDDRHHRRSAAAVSVR